MLMGAPPPSRRSRRAPGWRATIDNQSICESRGRPHRPIAEGDDGGGCTPTATLSGSNSGLKLNACSMQQVGGGRDSPEGWHGCRQLGAMAVVKISSQFSVPSSQFKAPLKRFALSFSYLLWGY